MSKVHQVIDGIIVHNTIRGDRSRELREGSLAEPSACQEVTHVHVRRSPGREGCVGHKVCDQGSHASTKRPKVGGVGLLPVIPELVDHLGERKIRKPSYS